MSHILARIHHIAITALLALALPAQAEPLRLVLDWSVNTNHSGLIVAQQLGYFADEGLEVDIVAPPQTGGVAILLSGRAHLAVSYQEEVTLGRNRGLPLLAVATVLQHNTSGFAAPAGLGITRPRHFEGKTYGGWGADVELAMVQALVEGDGGDFSKVQTLPIGDLDFFAATSSGIDLVWIFAGWTGIEADLRGMQFTYIPVATVPALDYYTPLLITSKNFAASQPDQLAGLMRAISRGYALCIEHPEQAAQLLLRYAPELNQALAITSQHYLADKYQAEAPRWGEMRQQVWQRFGDWMEERGLIDKPFDAASAYTNKFLPEL